MDEKLIYKWGNFYFKSDFKLFGLTVAKPNSNIKITAHIKSINPIFKKELSNLKSNSRISHSYHRYAVYNNKNIYCVLSKKITADVNDFVTHHVLPMILTDKKELILHGASIYRNKKSILFLGKSGSGKSTLVRYLSRLDWTITGDESQVLSYKNSVWMNRSLAPTLRYYKKNNSKKNLKIINSSNKFLKQVKCILILRKINRKQKLAVHKVENDSGISLLIQNCFLHQKLDSAQRKTLFRKIYSLYSSVPVFLVMYPHNMKSKRRIKEFIEI